VQWIGAMDWCNGLVQWIAKGDLYFIMDLWVVCGFMGLWVCGFEGLWICGFVGLWVLILDIFLELLVKKTEFPMIRHFAEIIGSSGIPVGKIRGRNAR
jgi:hypothetical protein